MEDGTRRTVLIFAVVLIGVVILLIERPWVGTDIPPEPANLPDFERQFPAAPGFGGASAWLNTDPLSLRSLQGTVVLVDFWTYSCINCIHTFPHVQGLYERYNATGFTVVGVHTPEFRFERDVGNIRSAASLYGLTYPIAVDSSYTIWNAYDNHYWPAEYLIDANGRVRHTHFGEGGYEETEAQIRLLLQEAGRTPPNATPASSEPSTFAPDVTPELYASESGGVDRIAIKSPEGYHPGQDVTYAAPSGLARDGIYLVGTWRETEESVTAVSTDARVLVKFRAGGGNLVMDADKGSCVPLLLDGAPIPPERKARDVDGSCIPGDGPRSYDFYAGPIETHTVDIGFPVGTALYTFDFAGVGRT